MVWQLSFLIVIASTILTAESTTCPKFIDQATFNAGERQESVDCLTAEQEFDSRGENVGNTRSPIDYISPKQMAHAFEEAAKQGFSEEMQMANAGLAVAEEVYKRITKGDQSTVLIVAGAGNNGGDGFVAARYLSQMGISTTLILLAAPEKIKSDIARMNFARLSQTGASVKVAADISTLLGLSAEFEQAQIIVDAIFGIGIRGNIKEPMAEAIRLINRSRAFRIAIDIPSGLDPITGLPANEVVKAHLTITELIDLKDRQQYTGEVLWHPVGIPR